MSALRLMTFNVQLPSLAMAVGQGQDNKAEARASEVAAYQATASLDSGAGKGPALVRIDTPVHPTTIVFTHLQASYDADNAEHRDVRAKQFDQIVQLLRENLGQSIPDWLNVIVVGDLNVWGDGGAPTDEWNEIFDLKMVEFGTIFADGWREFMHPPGSKAERDPGISHREAKTGLFKRLDYQCFKTDVPTVRALVPHHMTTPLRDRSDHWSLNARIQLRSPNCFPTDAINILSTTPLPIASAPGHSGSPVFFSSLTFEHEGSYQWVFVSKPGTYTIHSWTNAEFAVFAWDDLTRPLARLDTLSISDLPPDIQSGYRQLGSFEPKGETHVTRTPFFIRLRGVKESTKGASFVTVLEHRGDSPATAIALIPHFEVNPQLPGGQTLGADDVCWFRADIPGKFDGDAHTARFVLRNGKRVDTSVTLRDRALLPIGTSAAGLLPELVCSLTTPGESVFLSLRRPSLNDVDYAMRWDSALSFLRFTEPLNLRIDDETGPDWLGEDEFDLDITVDNEPLISDSWDDADAGEEWPDLAGKCRKNAAGKAGKADVTSIAFSGDIVISLLKTDGIAAHGSEAAVMSALSPSDQDIEIRKEVITISDAGSDGQVTFTCTLSRFPV